MDVRHTAVFKKVPEGDIDFVEELPAANTQGDTLEEVRANLEEAVTMALEANRYPAEEELGDEEVSGSRWCCQRNEAARSDLDSARHGRPHLWPLPNLDT